MVVSLNLLDPLLDAMETPQDAPRRTHAARDPAAESASRIAWPRSPSNIRICRIATRCFARADGAGLSLIDRPKVQFDLLREAEKEYVKNTGDKMEHWQRRMMARFTRNLASISGDLMAGVFDLAVAARSVVDDNYA